MTKVNTRNVKRSPVFFAMDETTADAIERLAKTLEAVLPSGARQLATLACLARQELAEAEARGRNKGLEEAAHLAWGNDCDTDRNWLDWGEDRNRRTAVCVSNEIATAIRALITKPTDSEEAQ